MKRNRDYIVEEDSDLNYFTFRIITGKFASVIFYFETVTPRKRWFRTPTLSYTTKIVYDEYGEVSKNPSSFDEVTNKILKNFLHSQ